MPKKRRFLRDHGVQMRVMEDVLEHHGLIEEYHAEVMAEMDNVPFWLGCDDGPGGMGESSDTEEPEAAMLRERQELERENERLRRALADQQAFVAAVQGVQECQAMRLEVERMRMNLEDGR